MNFIIKKNQLLFKNIFLFFILFFIILINQNLVFASFSEKQNDLEFKEKFLFFNNESGKIEEKICSVSKNKFMQNLYNKKNYEKNKDRIRKKQREYYYEKKVSSYKELIQKNNFEEEKNYRDSKTLQLFK